MTMSDNDILEIKYNWSERRPNLHFYSTVECKVDIFFYLLFYFGVNFIVCCENVKANVFDNQLCLFCKKGRLRCLRKAA